MAEIFDLDATDASNTGRWPEGMLGGDINNAGRAMEGYLARWYEDISGGLSSSGSSNAFSVTSSRTISALFDGLRMTFRANHSITGAATLNLNSLGAKDIKRFNGSSLSSGDIISGQPVDVIYSAALDDWIMTSALAALVGSTHADFGENALPDTPAADTARLYAFDDGAGTTLLAWKDSAGNVNVLRQATASNMEAASANSLVSANLQHRHPGHPKFWAFVTVSGGTPTLASSYNVASINDAGVGILTINFTTPFSSANWCCSVTVEYPSGGNSTYIGNVGLSGRAADSVTVNCWHTGASANATLQDPAAYYVIGYGDQ